MYRPSKWFFAEVFGTNNGKKFHTLSMCTTLGEMPCFGNILWIKEAKLSKWKLLNVIQRSKAISTLKQKHKYTIFDPNELESKLQWMQCSRSSSAFWRVSLAGIFYRSRRICLCTENRTRAAIFCSSHLRSSHLP